MKQYWQRLVIKIDALTLRERVIIFAMAALLMIVLINTALLNPQYAKQRHLSGNIKQEQARIAAMRAEIQQKTATGMVDPDKEGKERLEQLKQKAAEMRTEIQGRQDGFISPDKVSFLLEDILRRNAQLRLISLRKLPALPLNDGAITANGTAPPITRPATNAESIGAGAKLAQPQAAASVYRHGVEIVVQGGYLDLLNYLSQLESMPWQLFWGGTKLEVVEYPKATLTLTLFTLSLDKEWLNI